MLSVSRSMIRKYGFTKLCEAVQYTATRATSVDGGSKSQESIGIEARVPKNSSFVSGLAVILQRDRELGIIGDPPNGKTAIPGYVWCMACSSLVSVTHKNWQQHCVGAKHRRNLFQMKKTSIQPSFAAGIAAETAWRGPPRPVTKLKVDK